MTRRILSDGAIPLLSLLLSACSTLGGFQQAGVREGEMGAVIGLTSQEFTHRGAGNPYYDLEGQILPSLDLGFRYGFSDRFEAGILFSSFIPAEDDFTASGLGAEAKVLVHHGEGFDAALQLGYRYSLVALTDRPYDVRLDDLFFGGLLTWELSPGARVTLAPRFISRRYRPFDADSGAIFVPPSHTGTLAGGLVTFSLGLGKEIWLMPEVGWFTTDDLDIVHYGLGVAGPF